ASERVYEGFLSNDRGKAFMHGHSFTANPMGCAAALAGLDLLNSGEIQRSRLSLIRQQADFARSVMDHPNVEECFSMGTLLVIRLKRNRSSEVYDEFRDRVYALALANQVLLRPLGNVLYAMPPYTSTTEDLKIMYKGIRAILNNIPID
ncbi:MAG: aminotransferase class III-fold pyridoxal phosphate-dependent enzyme, partial [Bacteroidota bacterium]|nr:aminotransferase class III-fold pyridoxal phosphate-dependent enzyme [Bacteroidota bacterium]